jgi:RNA polymerase sigma-70 factor (ECF subfamily)
MYTEDTRLLSMTDRELILAYANKRDHSAFGLFVERHQCALISFAAAFLRDDSGAQDVVQETFLRVAQYPQRILQDDGRVSSNGNGHEDTSTHERNWLLKVARDLSIDNLRKKAVERRSTHVLSNAPPQTAPASDARAEQRDEVSKANAAIERLPERLREVVILKIREQKSYKEIAQILGLSATNVGFLLHQAMKVLSAELGK